MTQDEQDQYDVVVVGVGPGRGAAAAGALAGAQVNRDLVLEDTRVAVDAQRVQASPGEVPVAQTAGAR